MLRGIEMNGQVEWSNLAIAMIEELRMDYGPLELTNTDGVAAIKRLRERLDKRDREIERWAEAEHALSSAYLRLRQILDAFATHDAPTREEVWEHTEQRAREIVAERDQLRQQLARYERMGAGHA